MAHVFTICVHLCHLRMIMLFIIQFHPQMTQIDADEREGGWIASPIKLTVDYRASGQKIGTRTIATI